RFKCDWSSDVCSSDLLWRRLQNRKFVGYKFRRQHPIDPYDLDFYCPAAKLAVELDGSGHDCEVREKHDKIRENFLSGLEITVIRSEERRVGKECGDLS